MSFLYCHRIPNTTLVQRSLLWICVRVFFTPQLYQNKYWTHKNMRADSFQWFYLKDLAVFPRFKCFLFREVQFCNTRRQHFFYSSSVPFIIILLYQFYMLRAIVFTRARTHSWLSRTIQFEAVERFCWREFHWVGLLQFGLFEFCYLKTIN